jgi:hypothetical protein
MPCLKMALTTADEAMPKPVACFTHILDHAVRLFETGCPKVTLLCGRVVQVQAFHLCGSAGHGEVRVGFDWVNARPRRCDGDWPGQSHG